MKEEGKTEKLVETNQEEKKRKKNQKEYLPQSFLNKTNSLVIQKQQNINCLSYFFCWV